ALCIAAARADGADWTLWYRQPAANWNEALPVGSGRLGGMVFGNVKAELIQLNESSVWSGQRYYIEKPEVRENLPQVRQLLFDGKLSEAQTLVDKFMTTKPDPRYGSYQPLGDLRIAFEKLEGEVTDYRRQLDLDTAVARTSFVIDGARHTREVFASAADHVLVVRLTCERPGRISAKVELARPAGGEIRAEGNNDLILGGQCPEGGSIFRAYLRATAEGSKVSASGAALQIENADAVTLILAAGTNFYGGDPDRLCRETVDRAAAKPFAKLFAAHVADYQSLFRRVDIDLGRTDAAALPTDERLKRIKAAGGDPQLEALFFQYGRYLLISSSRPGGLPANLQGLWNPLTKPPWFSDYTININAEMNYWPAEVASLSECHRPLLDFIESLREPARRAAKERYGCRGATLSTRTTPWGASDLRGSAGLLWQDGMAWLSTHLWEHYAFTQDRKFLAERAYPAMKEAAEFYVDFLVEHPRHKWLVAGPTTSPENTYVGPDGKKLAVDMGPAMTMQIIRDVFNRCIEASEILGIDADFRRTLIAKREKLAPMRIGSDGRLMEWSEEYKEADPAHRHVSHLYGLYPANLITPRGTPELATAARKSLEGRGDGGTGWSKAWKINLWARLLDGDHARKLLIEALAGNTYPNLFDAHPPFQIDGNFGAAAAVAEMLVQSHTGEVHLLPALPAAWPEGRVTGLRARGGFVVNIEWKGGKLVRVTVRSTCGGVCKLRLGSKVLDIPTEAGKSYTLNGELAPKKLLAEATSRPTCSEE
ncbi:MAG: glycoside hydrolase family 95 protein, partial [Planctomycetota bacterium]|nr:glycoside hydrolase family 95 protein [Planctomycetota bacterium]